MKSPILVLMEHRDGKIKNSSWEALGVGQRLAKELGNELKALLIGSQTDALAQRVSERAGVEVLEADSEHMALYSPEGYCEVLSQVAAQESPYLILMGHTYQTMDFAPRLAARLDCGFISNCTSLNLQNGQLSFVRPVYDGKLNAEVLLKGSLPYLVSVQQGSFSAPQERTDIVARVQRIEIALSPEIFQRRILEVIQESCKQVDLSQAEIVVAGGRGVGSKEKFQTILDLAAALGAGIGASRPVTDGGWLPKEHQIGSSGQTVTPKLYIACGISGAIQHLVGMSNSGCIVAINKDPNAPIFRVADFGIVGDVLKVVPLLTSLVKEIRK